MAIIVVFDEINFDGTSRTFTFDVPDLRQEPKDSIGSNWNDEICSFRVTQGKWQLFEHINYRGLGTALFGPGTQIANCVDAGFPNNWISSLRKIED